MTRLLTLVIASVAVICFGTTGFTAEESDSDRSPAEHHAALFGKLDDNGDGSLAADEVPDEHRRLFERLKRLADKNGDGKLNKEEFVAGLEEDRPEEPPRRFDRPDRPRRGEGDRRDGPPPERRRERAGRPDGERPEGDRPDARRREGDRPDARRPESDRPEGARRRGPEGRPGFGPEGMRGPMMGPALMRALDANGDGKISSSEIADAAAALKKLDKNGDGEIGRDELGPPQMAGGFRGRFGDEPRRPAEGGERRSNAEALMNRFKQFDKDGDGKFKKDELPERLQERFEEFDINSDGVLEESDIRQMAARISRFRATEGDRPEGRRRGEGRRPDRPEGRGEGEGRGGEQRRTDRE